MSELIGNVIRDKAIIAGLLDSYWAMEPQILGRMTEVIMRHASGIKLDASEIEAIVGSRADGGQTQTNLWRRGNIAIIPITGVLVKHSWLVNGESQPRGTATLDIRRKLDAAMDDPSVEHIVALFDSPGGSVAGISDLAQAIKRADQIKPIYGMGEDMTCSGAFWLASQTRRIFINNTCMIGSIGVYTVLTDSSRRADREGFSIQIVKAGEYKGIGEPGVPISFSEKQVIQERINSLYDLFIEAVAAGRGMAPETIRQLADGRVHTGRAAIDLGLADEITTLEDLLADLEKDTTKKSTGRPGVPSGRSVAKNAKDSQTNVAASDKESEMNKENETSPQTTPAAEAEAIKAAAVKEANEAAAKRVGDLTAALGGRTELLTRAIAQGMSVTEAKAELADILTAENAKLAEDLKTANAQIKAASDELATFKGLVAKTGIDPAKVGVKDAGGDMGGEGDGGYEAMVQQLKTEGKSESRARIMAAKKHPEAHAAWLKTQQQK